MINEESSSAQTHSSRKCQNKMREYYGTNVQMYIMLCIVYYEKATVRKNRQQRGREVAHSILGPNMSILSSVFMCKELAYSYYQKQVLGECLSGAVSF